MAIRSVLNKVFLGVLITLFSSVLFAQKPRTVSGTLINNDLTNRLLFIIQRLTCTAADYNSGAVALVMTSCMQVHYSYSLSKWFLPIMFYLMQMSGLTQYAIRESALLEVTS